MYVPMNINVSLVAGQLSSDPEIRTLASGDRLAALQVTVRPDDGPAVSVPVAVTEPPAWIDQAVAGDDVVVAGVVRRRFFRAGGATASRVEVSAQAVARGRDRRGVERVLRVARASIE